jgi:hypothetical protein
VAADETDQVVIGMYPSGSSKSRVKPRPASQLTAARHPPKQSDENDHDIADPEKLTTAAQPNGKS